MHGGARDRADAMYIIAARLLRGSTASHHASPDLLQRTIIATAESSFRETGPALAHVYCRGDDNGISLILYMQAKDLGQAENGARELLREAMEKTDGMTGWTIAHCSADLISPVMDTIVGDASD
ncbi:hypothetical protein ACFYYP_00300 [Microbispora rosea]|uniref:hypothetical protein n=1 Tax=Microbispora rosea TaxID=58117 RepID=UPI0036A2E291